VLQTRMITLTNRKLNDDFLEGNVVQGLAM
jgi:hypothetical protein